MNVVHRTPSPTYSPVPVPARRPWWAVPASILLGTLAASLATATVAYGHLAPALDDNNRYIKISVLGDRLRLAYTVFIGEIPGAQTRPRLDKNRDGVVDAEEARQYGDEMAALISPSIRATLDGQPVPFSFTDVDVGMGTPAVAAGAFSVDLVTQICLGDGPAHKFVLFDTSRLPLPGETEIKLEPAPGVELTRATLGADGRQSQLEFKWIGADSPLATAGLFLEFSSPPTSGAVASDCAKLTKTTSETETGGGGARRLITIIGMAVIASTAVAIARRSRAANSRQT